MGFPVLSVTAEQVQCTCACTVRKSRSSLKINLGGRVDGPTTEVGSRLCTVDSAFFLLLFLQSPEMCQ